MRPLSIFVFSLFYFVTSSASTSSAPSSFPSLLFNLEPAFTATIKVSGRSPSVTVFGGELVNEPISGGTVVGPLVNATIEGGFAHPSIYKDESETGNVTVQAPVIDIYGKTDDGEAYYLHAAGLGSETGQVVRIVSIIVAEDSRDEGSPLLIVCVGFRRQRKEIRSASRYVCVGIDNAK